MTDARYATDAELVTIDAGPRRHMGRCPPCYFAYFWKGAPELKHATCPRCGGRLVSTTAGLKNTHWRVPEIGAVGRRKQLVEIGLRITDGYRPRSLGSAVGYAHMRERGTVQKSA